MNARDVSEREETMEMFCPARWRPREPVGLGGRP
jgi:hypothetical protein